MLYRFLLPLLLLWLCSSAPATAQKTGDVLDCGATAAQARLLRTYPDIAAEQEWLEADYARAAGERRKSLPPPYTLPIVFHVVHQNGPENLSEARILAGLDHANQAFANQGFYDRGTGVDTRIQFCLAQRTPDNRATNGITRTVSPLTDLEYFDEDRDLKNLVSWDPTQYINVYVVDDICQTGNSGCGVAGYAYLPSAHGRTIDGIVLEARWLGSNPANAGVLIHELGHYLGLYHTFEGGCDNDDCTRDGDRVCDTPPDRSKAAVPCTGTANSCTTDTDSGFATDQNDMIENYMDYGYFNCYSAFTAGQRDRMYFFIEGRRRSLLDNRGCLPPCPTPVVAGFTGGGVTVDPGTTITFTNTSTGNDVNTWREGTTTVSTTTDLTRTFTTEGTFRVTLVTESNDPLCGPDSTQQIINVVCSGMAAFTVPVPITEGQPATFTNQSSAGGYVWTIDGTPVVSGDDLTTTFPADGIYEVCLTADFGGCARTFCRTVYARPVHPPGGGTTDSCGSPFTYFLADRFGDDGPGAAANDLRAVVSDGSGVYYVAGSFRGLMTVAAVTAAGNLLWTTQLYPDLQQSAIRRLALHADGSLTGLGTGQLFNTNFPEAALAFRLDPGTGNLVWGRQYQINEGLGFRDIVRTGDGEYVIVGGATSGQSVATPREGIQLRVNAADGGINGPINRYQQTVSFEFREAEYDAATGEIQVLAAAEDATGAMTWTGSLLPDGTLVRERARRPSVGETPGRRGMVVTPAGVLAISPSQAAGVPRGLRLQFLPNSANAPGWEYVYQTDRNLLYHHAEANAAGYVLHAYYFANAMDATLVTQLDRDGNVLWANELVGTTFSPEGRNSLAVDGDQILIATQALEGARLRPALYRLAADGTVADGCQPIRPVVLNRVVTGRSLDEDLPLSRSRAQTEGEVFFWEPTQLILDPLSCRQVCDTTEICDNRIDDDGDGLVDCDDPDVAMNCCCQTGPDFDLGPDRIFCGPTVLFPDTVRSDWQLTWSAGPGGGATSDTLVASEPGVYSLTVRDSCGRMATRSIELLSTPSPTLQLRNDTTLCDNAVIQLSVPGTFASVVWSDGSTDTTLTAWNEGAYWVTATDACGRTQRDTFRLTIDRNTVIDLGRDTVICPGDLLRFSVPGFAEYQWSESTFLDCFDCPVVEFRPTSDTLLLLAARAGLGCVSSDSIRVSVRDTRGGRDTVFLCPGGEVLTGDTLRSAGGLYLQESDGAGCPRVDTFLVIELTLPMGRDTVSVCFGDSALVFGNYETTAGEYTASIPRAGACDSLHVTRLVVIARPRTELRLRRCPGDTVLVFGRPVTAAGVYTEVYPTASGCDSTATVVVEDIELSVTARATAVACGGAAAGAVEVEVSSGGSGFGIRWSNGRRTPALSGLTAGRYFVTVTSATGCTLIDTVDVLGAPLPPVLLDAIPETCPNDADGAILVLDSLPGVRYALDTGLLSVQTTFSRLKPGSYNLIREDTLGCLDTTSVTITGEPRDSLVLLSRYVVNFGDSVILVPLPPALPGDSTRWTLPDGTVIGTGPTLALRPEDDLRVFATQLDTTNGCPPIVSTRIDVIRDDILYVPSAFSPNGDGVNDVFRVFPGPAVEEVLELAVYDRWGAAAFRLDSAVPEAELTGWDGGVARGRPAGLGVYVYTVRVRLFTGEVVTRSGEVVLVR